jgi:hypothetical protein
MTLIIGASGKKQSGKNTMTKGIVDWVLSNRIYNVTREDQIKQYSFADMLKQKVCIDTMGLSYEQCFGTDEQKNSLTIYRWEKIPIDIRISNAIISFNKDTNEAFDIAFENDKTRSRLGNPIPRTGFMTAREVMQIVGTDLFRKYFDDNIWVNATLREIRKDNKKIALISDVRFPSEVEAITKEENGYVLRLTRNVCNGDSHSSETALDNFNFNIPKCFVLNNNTLTIDGQNKETIKIMKKIIGDLK